MLPYIFTTAAITSCGTRVSFFIIAIYRSTSCLLMLLQTILLLGVSEKYPCCFVNVRHIVGLFLFRSWFFSLSLSLKNDKISHVGKNIARACENKTGEEEKTTSMQIQARPNNSKTGRSKIAKYNII